MPRILRLIVILMAAVFCLPAHVNAAVGYTPGSFNVNDTGAASYSIPIAVPPGAAGMQPSLSLAYSSQSGNGLMGMGFSLQGLSAITRCPQTYATDGNTGGVDLTYNDRYCLDGQRLILVSGTYGSVYSEYRTERDTLTKIVAYGPAAGNGPSYFVAQTKSGQTIQYGNTTDSRILATGKTTAMVWNVNRIMDKLGNYLTVTYIQNTSTGEYYPKRIDYAGNDTQGTPPSSSVQFVYATRTDTFTGYLGGSTITSTQRLTNVQVFEGSTSIRDYRLTYDQNQATTMTQRSRLTALTECDSNLATADCLPATTFGWSNGSAGFSTAATNTNIVSFNNYAQYSIVMDADGDGTSDLMNCVITTLNTYTWHLAAYGNATGFNSSYNTGTACIPGNAYAMDNYGGVYYGQGFASILAQEIGGALNNMTTGKWAVVWWPDFDSLSTGVADTGFNKNPQLLDINGDSRSDLVFVNGSYWNIRLNTGSAFSTTASVTTAPTGNYSYARPIDYNGDGRMDLLVPGPLGGVYTNANWYVLQSTGTTFSVIDTLIPNTGYADAQILDVNGDSRLDLLYVNGSYWNVRYNTGAGFSVATITSIPATNSAYAHQADYNGDGRMDLMTPGPLGGGYTSNNWYVLRSTGNGFTIVNTGIPNTGYTNYPQFADIDGDGFADLLYYTTSWQVRLHNAGVPDQLNSITNGLGAQATVSYKPLTDNTVYSRSVSYTNPFIPHFRAPMNVVSQYTTSDGIGGDSTIRYAYKDALLNRSGRGFMGFASITMTDAGTGIITTTNYSQTWPTVGLVSMVTKTLGSDRLALTQNTLASMTYGTTNAYYYFPYIAQTVQQTFDLSSNGGAIISSVVTANTYQSSCATDDRYCDLTQIQVTRNDGTRNFFIMTTNNTYDYTEVSSWILGRLTNTMVASYSPMGTTQTRESSFTYYPTTGLLWTEVIEPNGNVGTINNIKQTTTYTYDGFGNKTGATITGADTISRPLTASNNASTASAPYAYTAGRFETNLTNAANQGETRTYDARFGTVSTLTGPNGLATNWIYDNFGRKMKETRADGTVTTWGYALCGAGCPTFGKYSVTQYTRGTPAVTVYYDMLDREIRTETQPSIYKDTYYNNLGQVDHVSRPYYVGSTAYWSYFTYDALGRVKTVSLPTPAGTTPTTLAVTTYNGLTTTVTQYRDGTALTTTQVKDAMGHLTSVTDANNGVTTYQYDPFGNLIKVTDPALNVTTMSYDIRGRKLSMTDPDMGYWQYKYDSVGDLIWQQDAKGQQVWMYYLDPLGRMTKRTDPEGDTTWKYDDTALSGAKAKGKLSRINWPGGSRTYTYDIYGRPKDEITTVAGTNYTLTSTYDLYGRFDTITYPSGFAVRNNYSLFGYLSSVTNASTGASYWKSPVYNAAGQTTAFSLGNNLTTVIQYDPATGLIKGISTGMGVGSATQYLTYQYDTLGNLKQRVDGNQANLTENFGYDSLNRMTSASIVGGASKTVSYDSIGNITAKSDVGIYTYQPMHKHAVRTAGSGSYTWYDANGNQLSGPNGRGISYTSFNQPSSITQGGKSNSFTYDGDHQRLTQTEADGTREIYIHPRIDLGAHYEQEIHTDGTVEHKNYIYAGKETIGVYTTRSVGSPDMRYFHKDHLGSIDTITNETGGIVERLSYDAWGKRRNGNWTDATTAITSLTHHGFTGHEMLDDVGLINMNARLYDPTLGRFLQADPTVQAPGNPQTLNRYSYAGNNPLTYVDPSGYGFFSHLWHVITHNEIIRTVVAIALAYVTYGYFGLLTSSPMLGGFAGGFVGGFVGSGGNLQAALYGGITGAVFAGIGQYADMKMTALDGDPWAEGGFNRVLAHAAGGGITSTLQGDKFGPGALAAGFAQGLAPSISKLGGDDLAGVTGRTVAAAVVGGTASVLGGGKFANGARTAAFARLFNDEGGTRKIKEAIDSLWDSTKENLKFGSSLSAAYGPGASVGSSYNLNGDTELDVTYSTGVMVEAGYHIGGTVYSSGSIQGAYQGLKACAIGCIDVKWNYQGGWSLGTSLEFPVALGARVTSGYTTSGRDVVDRLRR